ncbi:conserved hypothetical protein [Ricinus communis]|uniref:TauD/TfdA-like domain-containing protein n=1 Tax=Ricinus communis TaxID=3988 RepID=B9TDY3_RICCO|nr:conserved hypothetical protein [Ricinus communis]
MQTIIKKIDADEFGSAVTCSHFGDSPLPLVIQPANEKHRDLDALLDWASAHRDALDRAIADHGAVLLRDFAVDDTAQFEKVSELFPAYEMGYEGGATARAQIAGKVFEATRVPPDVWIMLHQEMAYMRTYPAKLAFFCKIAAEGGGETTIGDMRKFTAALPPQLLEEIASKGVRYQRNFRSPDTRDERSNPVFNHRTWVEAFYTEDRNEVEADCHARGLDFEWLPDGSITTWNTLPGTARHKRDGDTVYFSQLHTQIPHPRWMGANWDAYSAVYKADVAKPYDASFGDGTPLSDADIRTIYDGLDRITVSFPWQHGDVLFVDNIHTAHGRNPFVGKRDVQVALLA